MGVLCSAAAADKSGHVPPESQSQLIGEANRLPDMPHHGKAETNGRAEMKSLSAWKKTIGEGDFEDVSAYHMARRQLQLAEKENAFDADAIKNSSDVESQAADMIQRLRKYDLGRVYGETRDFNGQPTGKRKQGEHFLGNVDLINQTELIKVARKMPKGAHLHIHFNSCLPGRFLIRQARDIDAMYIRSTLPLTNPSNMDSAQISFMVMTLHEATHVKGSEGHTLLVPLGNVWDEDYIPNTWMSYKKFQYMFSSHNRRVQYQHANIGTDMTPAEIWLEEKMQISEDEAHNTRQTGHGIWEKFNHRTRMMKGLFAYESAFRSYTRACIRDFVSDNIQYAEIRPNFMHTNSLKTDDGTGSIGNEGIMRIIDDELRKTKVQLHHEGKYFGGMKVIYCTPRSFSTSQIALALDECICLKKKYKDLLCGFDLVGHEEMGNELRHFIPEFLNFRQKCKSQGLDIPFLFHCGETLEHGGKIDGNLFDAILLNSKRIGHGYSLARHPILMDIFKEKGMAVESCPISNEILGLTPVIAGHHLPILLANNVPCTINSDNATFYKSSLSHDFYQVMIGSEAMTLQGWKQLALWSLQHSCMTSDERVDVTLEWTKRWDGFCHWIVQEYGPLFQAQESVYETAKQVLR